MVDLVDTRIENRWIVQPHHANPLGTVHGGRVLEWMDEAAAMSAMRFAGESCVTARMDQVNFKRPIPVGDIAFVRAYVYAAGRTSVRLRVEVFRETPQTGEREATTESFAVFVAIDDDREPVEVPDLTVGTDEGERLRERALADEERPD